MECQCGGEVIPIYFEEAELDKYGHKTGRYRTAVDALVCQGCLKEFTVDSSMDGHWRNFSLRGSN